MQVYAIGDIHGQIDLLQAAHRLIEADGGSDAQIVHIGDLGDRGPDSRGVIAYLADGHAAGRNWITIQGNHDRMLTRFLDDPDWIDPGLSSSRHWLDHPGLGAAATVASFGVDPEGDHQTIHDGLVKAVPADHRRWLAGLPNWYLHPAALFVHAGVRPGMDLQDQAEDDLVWIRKGFLDSAADHGPLVVHGHTSIDRPTHYGNRLNIDSGAAYGGPLSVVVIDDRGAQHLTENGRLPLRPGAA